MGVWIIVGLLFLSATGLTWSKYAGENIGELRTALNWTTPSVEAEVGTHADHSAHHGTATPAAEATSTAHAVEGLDAVMDTAAALGIDQAVEISIPTEHDVAYVVTESRAAWQFSPNSVAVGHLDGTGSGARILDVSWFADWPLAAKLTNWGIAAHMGLLFGLVNQFLLALLAGILVAIIVRGYQMWWQRRPRGRSGSRPGRAPSRGMLRRLIATPTGLAIAGTGLAVIPLIGWFVPLLGLPLLAFLAVDIILGMFARHRADTPAVDTSPSREEQTARLTSAEP